MTSLSPRYDGSVELRTSLGPLRVMLCVSHQFATRYFLQRIVTQKYSASTVAKVIPGFYLQVHPSTLQDCQADLTSEMEAEEPPGDVINQNEEKKQHQQIDSQVMASLSSDDFHPNGQAPQRSFFSFFFFFFLFALNSFFLFLL